MADFTGVNHVAFTVRDLAKSSAWYSEVLGLTKIGELPDEGGRGAKVLLRHPGSGLVIVLCAHRSNPGEPFSEFRTGLDHLSFTVPNRAELDAWQRRFAERGVTHSPIYESPTGRGTVLVFRDPDNLQLEMYVPRPT